VGVVPTLVLITHVEQKDEKLAVVMNAKPFPEKCEKAFKLAKEVAKRLDSLFSDMARRFENAKQVYFVEKGELGKLVISRTCMFLEESYSATIEPGIIFRVEHVTNSWTDDYGHVLYTDEWWDIVSYPITEGGEASISIGRVKLRDIEELRKVLPESKIKEMIKSKKLHIVVPPHAVILGDDLKQKLLNSKNVLVIEAKTQG
jgi:hypothetical protein